MILNSLNIASVITWTWQNQIEYLVKSRSPNRYIKQTIMKKAVMNIYLDLEILKVFLKCYFELYLFNGCI